METTEGKIHELTARLEAHVARCEERDKTIFNRLDSIERNIRQHTFALLAGMGGVIITLLLRSS
jgi:hypothetical protein|tara:strand:+ start:1982 stop:2173 length:192 start_codon:yes stop_codon:yes gene_type:complete